MLHEKFFLTAISKSQITLSHAIFFNTVTGEFIVAKSGIKNNSLKPTVITANGTIPENGEYSDGFVGENDSVIFQLYQYVNLLNTNEKLKSYLLDKSDWLCVIADFTKKEEVKISVDELPSKGVFNPEIKEIVVTKPSAVKVVKEAVAIGVIKPLSVLEATVLTLCFAKESDTKEHVGISYTVCEGNLSLAGAFSTLQRKGYIETFMGKVNKRQEKYYRIIRKSDGKLL